MSFAVFLKKEFTEILKTSKAIVLPVLFIFFGILSPITAKLVNQLLSTAGDQQGIKIIMTAAPSFNQAYEQLFKNIYSIMVIALIIIFAGCIADEKSKGTAALMLTKNLSREAFVITKAIASVALFTVSYALSAAACIYYTYLLFGKYNFPGIFTSLGLYWVFGIMIVMLTLLASTLSKSTVVAAVGGLVGYVIISAVDAFQKIGKYTPGELQALSVKLVDGASKPKDALIPVIVTAGLAVAAFICSIVLFRKREL